MRYLISLLAACLLSTGIAFATPLGSDFTYQGQLTDNGAPASGHYYLQFALFTATSGGNAVDTITLTNQTIGGGLINATLDFTDAPYDGQALWVEVSVRATGDGVHGNSTSSSGVFGASASGAGVWGESAGYDAVHGHTSNPNGNTSGVAGFGDGSNNGVFGVSAEGHGVIAIGHGGYAPDGAALYALNDNPNGYALFAQTTQTDATGNTTAIFDNDCSNPQPYIGCGEIISGRNQGTEVFVVTTVGDVYAHAAFHPNGIDYSDRLPAETGLEPGDVVAIGDGGLLHRSTTRSETDVAGVYSTKPGVIGHEEDEQRPTIPVALAGVIPVKASAENGAIRSGDLLVSSSAPGRAMRAPKNPNAGTVIGKAMQTLDRGTGEIEMLVMLR